MTIYAARIQPYLRNILAAMLQFARRKDYFAKLFLPFKFRDQHGWHINSVGRPNMKASGKSSEALMRRLECIYDETPSDQI